MNSISNKLNFVANYKHIFYFIKLYIWEIFLNKKNTSIILLSYTPFALDFREKYTEANKTLASKVCTHILSRLAPVQLYHVFRGLLSSFINGARHFFIYTCSLNTR